MLTKTIANRIKPFLNEIIKPVQSSFVPGRNILDNIWVITEIAHAFKKALTTKTIMAFKIDLSKAYDSLEWEFIKKTLNF